MAFNSKNTGKRLGNNSRWFAIHPRFCRAEAFAAANGNALAARLLAS